MTWVTEKGNLQWGIYETGQRRGTYNGVSMIWVTEKGNLQWGIYDMGHREGELTMGYL